MPAAARLAPLELFTPRQWDRLRRRSAWRGLALVAHAWAVILLAALAAMAWPVLLPLSVMIIGGRQLGLAILMHDAAHGALHPDPRVNDWVGEHLTGGGLQKYRDYHLKHHKYAQQAEDPDLSLSAPFPITGRSLRRKILRDLTGQTYYKQRWAGLVERLMRTRGRTRLQVLLQALKDRRRFFLGLAVTLALTAPLGYGWAWFALWLVPQATWLPMITRLRNIAEHACVAANEPDPLRQARTTRAGLLARALLAPYYVNYHCEHHMFMYLPCYRLPEAHALLARRGTLERMLTAPSYLNVLRQAASAPARAAA